MPLIDHVDGWSPRYHHLVEINKSWDIGVDTTLESIMDTLDPLEQLIDDYKAFKQANKPAPVTSLHGYPTPREGGF